MINSNSSPFYTQHQQFGRPNVASSSSSNEGQQSQTTFYNPVPGMVTSISDDNIHAGSLYMGRSEPYNNATMVGSQQTPGIMSSTQPTEEEADKNEAEKSVERTSNEKQFWKRTTNSDAAIARFFARVVAARDADSENTEVPVCGPGGFNILAWSENTNLMANPQNDPSSAIPSASSSIWSGHEGGNVIGGGMEPTIPTSGVITPDSFTTAGDQIGTTGSTSARRTSELSLLSQQSPASMMPSATGVTTPSDSGAGQGGFRSHRPPPLRIESLPTFDQHQQMQQFNVIGGTGANVIQSQSGVRANSEGQIPSVLLTPITLQQQQQERMMIASPSVLTPNISPGAINSPSLTISPSAISHDQQQQQQQYFPSAARTTPITELSSHLLALGHSTQQGSNEEDTGN